MSTDNLQIRLASRPRGWVSEENFELTRAAIPAPGEGQALVQVRYLSLDPYMRGRMDDAKSYAPKVELGEIMVGGTVGEVIESNDPRLQAGDHVAGMLGWQQYGVCDGRELRKVDVSAVPETAYLGTVGMPGVTAWYGLTHIGEPKAGETVVVSAASGAVGSVVGQLAKIKGCRAVGIAGGAAKCRYVTEELGFDACVDYKAGRLEHDLTRATPDGIDIYYDNVGGEILDAALARLNAFARIPLCGLISGYNGQPMAIRNLRSLLVNRVKLQGFIVTEHPEVWPEALKQLGQWVAEGRLKYRETVTDGLENAPRAFIGLLKGENFGKQIVKVI